MLPRFFCDITSSSQAAFVKAAVCLALIGSTCISASAQSTLPQPAANAAITGLNAVTAALQKAGVKRCAVQMQNVTSFLTQKSHSGTTVFPLATNPDDSLVSISSEIMVANVVSYVGATFAPRADGCSAVYEHVSHWQNQCEDVYAAQYASFKPQGSLQVQIKVYYNNAATQVMMVPAGTGCVVIKKEIVH